MHRWGLLDRFAATGCPPVVLRLIFDVGPFALEGGVTDTNAGRGGFCPRRTVLDKLLVDAAVDAGAELREGFTAEALVWKSIESPESRATGGRWLLPDARGSHPHRGAVAQHQVSGAGCSRRTFFEVSRRSTWLGSTSTLRGG